ncbi:MAG: tRNA pseudouridine(55) synthase [Nitrososphaerales archaeon]
MRKANHPKKIVQGQHVNIVPDLCKSCQIRQGLVEAKYSSNCAICGSSLSNLPHIAKLATQTLRKYEFESFVVGTTVPQSMIDAEDEIRSRFKIHGKESLKTQVSKEITSKIIKNIGSRVDYSRPELTVLVSLSDQNVSVTPRSLWLSGSYTKNVRGMPQRSSPCRTCNGLGCADCNYIGSNAKSIQFILTRFFVKSFSAETCNFVWLGSEDENSLVKGDGRPFYVEVVKPSKRHNRKLLSRSFNVEGVGLKSMQILTLKPKQIPPFAMDVKIYLLRKNGNLEEKIKPEGLSDSFVDRIVSVKLSKKLRTVSRNIYNVSVQNRKDKDGLVLKLKCDGGIPIRKLITGDQDIVFPNFGDFLKGFEIDETMPFDVMKVEIKS